MKEIECVCGGFDLQCFVCGLPASRPVSWLVEMFRLDSGFFVFVLAELLGSGG